MLCHESFKYIDIMVIYFGTVVKNAKLTSLPPPLLASIQAFGYTAPSLV